MKELQYQGGKKGIAAPDGHKPLLLFLPRTFKLGGAERQVAILANLLFRTGKYNVGVLCLEEGDRLGALLDPGISLKLVYPGSGKLPRRFFGHLRFLVALRGMHPDLLLPFTDWPNKLVGAFWPLSGAAAMVWNQRDEGREITGGSLEKPALKLSSCFVANSPDGIEFLALQKKIPREQIHLIPNTVLSPTVSRNRREWRRKLDIDPETLLVTMLASLSRFKDHDTLLKAWKEFQESQPEAKLLLAGKELEQAQVIRARAASIPGVRILGEISDIGGLLAASDLLIHSSWREGSPNSVFEAMISGVAVVATGIPGTRLALGEDYPWLVPPRDPSALAATLGHAMGNSVLRQELGQRNRQRALELFSPEKILPQWEKLIQSLLRGPSPKPVLIPK